MFKNFFNKKDSRPSDALFLQIKEAFDSLKRAGIKNLTLKNLNKTPFGTTHSIVIYKNCKPAKNPSLKINDGESSLLHIAVTNQFSTSERLKCDYRLAHYQKPAPDQSRNWIENAQPMTPYDTSTDISGDLSSIVDKLYDEIIPSILNNTELDDWTTLLDDEYKAQLERDIVPNPK